MQALVITWLFTNQEGPCPGRCPSSIDRITRSCECVSQGSQASKTTGALPHFPSDEVSRLPRRRSTAASLAATCAHFALTFFPRVTLVSVFWRHSRAWPSRRRCGKIFRRFIRLLLPIRTRSGRCTSPTSPRARGFVYLASDWFSGRVLSWRLSITMDAGSPPIVIGIMTATVGITAADVGAEQSTRPERAQVVASCVKEGRCAGINDPIRIASTPAKFDPEIAAFPPA